MSVPEVTIDKSAYLRDLERELGELKGTGEVYAIPLFQSRVDCGLTSILQRGTESTFNGPDTGSVLGFDVIRRSSLFGYFLFHRLNKTLKCHVIQMLRSNHFGLYNKHLWYMSVTENKLILAICFRDKGQCSDTYT